jgi:hypothetical protein
VSIDHRVTTDLEDIRVTRGRQHLRDADRLCRVAVGLDRATGGDLADHREAVSFRHAGLGNELTGEPEAKCRVRRQPNGPRLGRPTLQESLALEDLEMVVDGRRRGQADGLCDLANRGREAAGAQRRGNEIEDLSLSIRVVLGHSRLLCGP